MAKKQKLKKFSEFSEKILPHEASYLLSIENFEDDTKRGILERIAHNSNNFNRPIAYDTTVNKRKYSNLKNWIESKLNDINVDYHFEWINEMDRKVMTDSITPKDEVVLLKAIKNYQHPIYNFIKLYELLLNYRHFLLIRLRYDDHQKVNLWITKYKEEYQRARDVNDKLHQATVDIIDQYSLNNTESRHWESWLTEIFYDSTLDGNNRYLAIIRLTFMYFNYREFEKLKVIYDDLDKLLAQGFFYSKRILYNYYANRLMLHSKFDVLQQAEEYGYLSIRQKNADHLQYLTNFSSILLRRGKIDEALSLMKESMAEMKTTHNFHNKIGFVAFYVKCLNLNGQPADGERYAESFLRINKEHVLSKRWYIFFTAYIHALLLQEKYEKVISICKKYGLLVRDEQDQKKPIYLPTIRWYYEMSLYMEGRIGDDKLIDAITTSGKDYLHNHQKSSVITNLLDDLKIHVPHIIKDVKSALDY
ncbi:MAG: hypothetical protein ABJH05_13555 [Fulvivirga sp.]